MLWRNRQFSERMDYNDLAEMLNLWVSDMKWNTAGQCLLSQECWFWKSDKLDAYKTLHYHKEYILIHLALIKGG